MARAAVHPNQRATLPALVLVVTSGAVALTRVHGLEADVAFRIVILAGLFAWAAGALGGLMAGRAGARGSTTLAVALAGAAPFVGAAALSMFSDPLVPGGLWADDHLAARTDRALVVVGASAVAAGLGALLMVVERPRVAAWFPWFAALALGACGALVLGSVLRLRSPEPGAYVATLPLAGALPPAEGPPTRTELDRPWSWDQNRIYETRLGRMLVTRVCGAHVCGVLIGETQPSPGEGLWGPHAVTTLAASDVTVRRDDRHDFWIVEHAGEARALRDGKAITLRVDDIADAARPPRTWIVASLLGLLGAVLILVSARRRAGATELIRRGLEGHLGDDGWISFQEALAPLRAPSGCRPGPVVVVAPTHRASFVRGASLYRGKESAGLVLEGTRDELLAAERALWTGRHAIALAIGLVSSAPLAAASSLGLVL